MEVAVNAKMDMNIAASEPATSALCQFWWFRHLLNPSAPT